MIFSSCFNVLFSAEDICAVWNSIVDEIIRLSPEEYRALLRGRPEQIERSRQQLLEEKGILVSEPGEMERFLALRHEQRQLRSLYFRILTTTACNAGCDYCYERDFPVQTMDHATAVAAARFLVAQYRAHPMKHKVTLEWFGGEPTLNPYPIQVITEQLRREKIPFQSCMISNGILLTEELIGNAADWNLQRIQITLDAAGEEYEAVKHVPAGSFARVLNNIDRCLCAGITVAVRINYAGNRQQSEKLIAWLAARYPERKQKLRVYIAPVYSCEKAVSAERMQEVLELDRLLQDNGLATFEELYRLPQRDRCFSATPWGFTMMPNGTLINCSHNVSAENSVGTVWDFQPENGLYQAFQSPRLAENCGTCPLVPICGGGCPGAQYGVAQIQQCIPYRNVITEILRLRLMKSIQGEGKRRKTV